MRLSPKLVEIAGRLVAGAKEAVGADFTDDPEGLILHDLEDGGPRR